MVLIGARACIDMSIYSLDAEGYSASLSVTEYSDMLSR